MEKVSIGTPVPIKLFSVNGSIMVDQGNLNTGTLNSATLRFGTNSNVGISWNLSGAGNNVNGSEI